MNKFTIDNFVEGWVVGAFHPSLHWTKDFELGIKSYKKGATTKKHIHRESKEMTIVISGIAEMTVGYQNKVERLLPGMGLLLNECEAAKFEAIEDCATVVVKFPSIPDDKEYVEDK